jgi:hypothetical protein
MALYISLQFIGNEEFRSLKREESEAPDSCPLALHLPLPRQNIYCGQFLNAILLARDSMRLAPTNLMRQDLHPLVGT